MKLTTKKLESLILETMGRRFTPEQENKIYEVIETTRMTLKKAGGVLGFYPPMVTNLFAHPDRIKSKLFSLTKDPFWKPYIMEHYDAAKTIADNLTTVNQFLVLLEDLEIDGEIATVAKESLYGDDKVVITASGKTIPMSDLSNTYHIAIKFLEEIQNFNKLDNFFGDDGTINFEGMRATVDSFHNIYSDFKDYLERIV